MARSIFVLCLIGFVAGGVIVDRSRQDSQSTQGTENRGENQINSLTRNELIRQKFVLDVLQQVELPVQNQKLLDLNNGGDLNENMYLGPIDDNMELLLDLIRTNRALGRNTVFSMNNENDLRQMAGLYQLLVRSRDFETFQQTAVYARINLNPVLFVNALVLAIAERADTKALVSPALYEILPTLYQDDSLTRQLEVLNSRSINNNGNSVRQNILDIISLGRQIKQTNLQSSNGDDGRNSLNRAELWMPWREMHRQLAIQKSLNRNVILRDGTRQSEVVLTSSNTDGLIADDIGLRSVLDRLLVEVILKQSILRNQQNDIESSANMRNTMGDESGTSNGNRLLRGGGLQNNVNSAGNGDVISQRQRLRDDSEISNGGLLNNANLVDNRDDIISEIQGLRGGSEVNNRNRLVLGGGLRNSINGVGNRDNIVSQRQGLSDGREINNIDRLVLGGGLGNNVDSIDNTGNIVLGTRDGRDESNVNNRNRLVLDSGMRSNINVPGNRNNIVSQRQGLREINNSDRLVLGGGLRNNVYSVDDEANIISQTQGLRDDSDINNSQQSMNGRLRNSINIGGNRGNTVSERLGLSDRIILQSNNNNRQIVRGSSDESDWLNAHRDLDIAGVGQQGLLGVRNAQLNIVQRGQSQTSNQRLNQLHNIDNSDDLDIGGVGQQGLLGVRNAPLNIVQRGQSQTRNQRLNQLENIDNSDELANGQRQLNRVVVTDNNGARGGDVGTSSGQQLLQQLQQLIARLNIEDISLRRAGGNSLNIEENILQQSNRIDDRQRRVVLNKINEISERLNGSLQKMIQQVSNTGEIIARGGRLPSQTDHIVLIEILNEVLSLTEYVPDGQVSSLLENPTTRLLMRHIVNTIERQLQTLQGVRNSNDIAFNGVRINAVAVDRLQTYLEYSNVDLSNMVRQNTDDGNEGINQLVVGRIARLNHKPFNIKLDVNSDRNQRVVVRTLLVPKVDALGNLLSPTQQRQNVLLVDIADVDLKLGQNRIMRQSRDITWTGRDTTTYTEIYQRVMNALQRDQDVNQDATIGQSNLLPNRLLIPRGRADGLEMQLIIVITPAKQNIGTTRTGLDAVALDNLPITYPLDRDVNDVNTIVSLSNVDVQDVRVYHDNQLKRTLQ